MRQKLHRNRGRMFSRRKNGIMKILGWVALIGVATAAGVGAMAWIQQSSAPPSNGPTPSSSSLTTTATSSVNTTTTVPTPSVSATPRAAVLPLTVLRDGASRAAALDTLKAEGYTAVLFDIKSENGVLSYAFSGKWAQESEMVAADALTEQELSALLADCASRNLTAIPRVYAFKDSGAPGYLKTARIQWSGDKKTLWLDARASAGGKAWLNPYSADAQSYIIELATELSNAGCTALMLDGVEFPARTFEAYFGTSAQTADGYAATLTKFVGALKAAVGDTQVMLACTLPAALGTDTAMYGGNPLTFGADTVCPMFTKEALQAYADAHSVSANAAVTASLKAVSDRLSFVEGTKPAVMPWLENKAHATNLPDATAYIVQ